ncbi:hypothetical protein JL722_10440 [Aureococcus anophagefferens]|nr:hypothetical protein JL722_10440 [Aureococcus anophagefferens]
MAGVWAVIASLVPASELPELARAVGEERMEKCGDLRAEADALREIVEGYASENAAPLDDGADAARRSASGALLLSGGPERDMLERKIAMLLDYLGEQGEAPSAEKDARAPTRRKEVEALRKSLNVETFDEVLAEVRSLLDAEAEDLLREIDDLTATFDRVDEAVVERAQGAPARAAAAALLPSPPGKAKFSKTGPIERKSDARDKQGNPRMFSRTLTAPMPAPPAMGPLQPPPRKSKLRARMQNAREEQFLNDW